jgi:hypothetical protein
MFRVSKGNGSGAVCTTTGETEFISGSKAHFGRLVGNSYLGISSGLLVIRPQSVSAVGAPNFREQDSLVAQFYEPEECG